MLPELQPLLQGSTSGAPVRDQDVVRLECRMVPPRHHRAGTIVLPCTAAARVGFLLELSVRHAAVDIVDRGWCRDCPAGAPAAEAAPDASEGAATLPHPAQAAVETASAWLEALEGATRIRLRHEPLDPSLRPARLPPAEDPGPVLDRRRFFQHAIERPAGRHASPQPMGSHGRAAHPASSRRPSAERARQHRALVALAERSGTPVPTEFFPALRPGGECCDARMCEALCPTRALTAVDGGQQAWLRFDPAACIACGACVRACPQGALTLQPHGGSAEVQVLFEHRRALCPSCGETYTPTSGEPGLCPGCQKTQRFIDDARRQLFGAMP